MADPAAVAATAAAIAKGGVAIAFTRNIGFAPNVVTVTANIKAVVRTMQPDTTSPAQAGLSVSTPGQINQNQRLLIVMSSDLMNGGITLPVRTGDKINIPSTGEILNVNRADPYKRAFAGAIEIIASAPT